MRVLIFYAFFYWKKRRELSEILSKINFFLRVKYLLLPLDFNETWNFLDGFSKNAEISNHENSDSGIRVFPFGRIDRWTAGHDAANNRFSQFCKRA